MINPQVTSAYDAVELCNLLFVYGTLKKGFGNHRTLENAEFVGEATFQEKGMHMVSLGGFPAIERSFSSVGQVIYGEVYRMTKNSMSRCDMLEGYPNFYNRKIFSVLMEDDKTMVDAWVYYLEGDSGHKDSVEGGVWL